MPRRIPIGYVCSHGHFQFYGDPEGDSCGTKNVGYITVEPIRGLRPGQIQEVIRDSMLSLYEKIEYWRKNA